ncbi:hypothetical protein [Amaricoccus solimangrovi]|uniref:Uncharacterized protein n=1 Tax=Amaricoccus solimangrovi TaxID=2589815 RepID=A0A501WQ24_9RHOB|nr:hypothetical protein [Amaricoccus solimangrovi]TPE47876.1 hypothetical protein FJM51_19255 [Amaricoccus solimangrovi]
MTEPLSSAAQMMEALSRYLETGFTPVLAPSLSIGFEVANVERFNASVVMADETRFEISTHLGCATVLEHCIASMETSGFLSSHTGLAAVLFGSAAETEELHRVLLHFAALFVQLHEFAHILCGHLKYCDAKGLLKRTGAGLRLDETGADGHSRKVEAGEIPSDWLKLIELEADSMAFEMLLGFSYEFLLAGDVFAEKLRREADPDRLSARMTHTLGEIAITAGAAVFYLLEMEREGRDAYPLPETRLLNILNAWVQKTLLPEGGGRGLVKVRLDDGLREALADRIVPSCFTAAQFGVACAEAYPELPATGRGRISFDEAALMDGFINGLLGEATKGASAGQRELAALQPRLAAFQLQLTRHPLGT